MKRIFPLALVSILLLVQGCKKEEITAEEPEDFVSFLSGRQQAFYGQISDSTVSWVFGPKFQMAHSSCVTTVNGYPEKILSFDLVAEYDLNTRIHITIPRYLVGTEDLFTKVVSVGEKILGPQDDNFFFRFTLNTKNYTTNGDQMGSRFKVLQMIRTTDIMGKDIILVWFSVNCKFYDGAGKYAFSVQKGKFLASFMYNL